MNNIKKSTKDDISKPRLSPKQVIKGLKINIELVNEQKLASKSCYENDYTFIVGEMSSGKTLVAVHNALTQLQKGLVEKIWITRPILPNNLGILPGELSDKMLPYIYPIKHNIEMCVGKDSCEKLFESGLVEIMPIDVAKGVTFVDSFVICDECIPKDYYVVVKSDNKKKKKKISKLSIGDEVLSYNETTKTNEYKKVTKAWSNGIKSVDRFNFSKGAYFESTNNHRIMTSRGWAYASDIKVGDVIKTTNHKQMKMVLNQDQLSILYGSILGDGSLQTISEITSRLQWTHGVNQKEYLDWKLDIFNCGESTKKDENGYSNKSAYIGRTKTLVYNKTDNHKLDVISKIDIKSLAIMIMDDGYFYAKENRLTLYSTAESLEQSELLSEKLKSMGYDNSVYKAKNGQGTEYYYIYFFKDSTNKVLIDTAMYFHESMSYKNPYFDTDNLYTWNTETFYGDVITSIDRNFRQDDVWDLTIEDNHNFYITKKGKQSYLVHNCQDTNYEDIRTIMSRLGKKSKMALCCSRQQISRKIGKYSSIHVIDDAFSNHNGDIPGVKIIELKSNHRNNTLSHLLPLLDSSNEKINKEIDLAREFKNESMLKGKIILKD